MPAAEHNFFLEQGSNFDIVYEYLDADLNRIVLSNIDDCAVFIYRPNTTDGSVSDAISLSSTTPDSGVSINTLGQIVISLKYTTTKNFTWDTAQYDLYIIRDKNASLTNLKKQYRLATGTMTLVKVNFPIIDCAGFTQQQTPNNNGSPTVTPTVTTTVSEIETLDLCSIVCGNLDLYSNIYNSSTNINIIDNNVTNNSININNNLRIENIQVIISGLKHESPQDLSMVLIPPSGSGILLSHNHKINNYNSTNGLSYVFSRRADPDIYLHNITNNPYVNIYDKRQYHPSGSYLKSGFSHLYGHAISGSWTLQITDSDPLKSGILSSWGLIIGYNPDNNADMYVQDWDSYYQTPTPTPTPTVTLTPTITRSPTPTPTITPTRTRI